MQQCKFNIAWAGQCENGTDEDFCFEHRDKKCSYSGCDALAVTSCPDSSQFVCGNPLCEEHPNCGRHQHWGQGVYQH